LANTISDIGGASATVIIVLIKAHDPAWLFTIFGKMFVSTPISCDLALYRITEKGAFEN